MVSSSQAQKLKAVKTLEFTPRDQSNYDEIKIQEL
jgi:hypothetical protein